MYDDDESFYIKHKNWLYGLMIALVTLFILLMIRFNYGENHSSEKKECRELSTKTKAINCIKIPDQKA